MTKPILFNPLTHTIGLNRDLVASKFPERPDPPIPIEGITFGVATMSENSPHNGEMHPDGDEILYVISGRLRVTGDSAPGEAMELGPGDACLIPKGEWHNVDILEKTQMIFLTPGPNGDHRPLDAADPG